MLLALPFLTRKRRYPSSACINNHVSGGLQPLDTLISIQTLRSPTPPS